MITEDKQRIEKEAEVYTVSVESRGSSFWQGMYRGYVAGATTELERSEKLLQEYREVIRELLPIAERSSITVDNPDWKQTLEDKKQVINRAKSLIETTSKPEKQ